MHLKQTSSKSASKQDNDVQYIQYLDEPVQQSILKSSDHENSDFINVLKKRNLKSVQEIAGMYFYYFFKVILYTFSSKTF